MTTFSRAHSTTSLCSVAQGMLKAEPGWRHPERSEGSRG